MDIVDDLLDFGEKVFKVNIRYYLKNVSYLFFIEIVLIILGVLFTVVFTRLMTKEAFGQYNYVLSIIGLFSIFSLQGLSISLMRSVSKGFDGDIWNATKTRLRWSLIGSVIIGIISLYFFIVEPTNNLYLYILLCAIFFSVFTCFDTYNFILYGKRMFKTATKLILLFNFVTIGITILVIYFTKTLLFIILGFLIASSVTHLSIFNYIVLKVKSNDKKEKTTISYGKHLTLNQAVINILPFADKIVVASLLGFVDLAVYSIAVPLSEKLKKLVMALNNVIFPDLVRMKPKNCYAIIKNKAIYVILFSSIIAFIGILLAPFIIDFLYTKEYSAAILYIQILLISLVITTTSLLLYNALQAQKAIKELYFYNTSITFFEIITMIIMIIFFGLLGAVITKVISRTYGLGLLLYLTKRHELSSY